jgi:arsenate reductase (thioredoxin)
VPNVLFVCVQNAGRSQISQLLYERAGGTARSAGSRPAKRVHENVAAVFPELADRVPRELSRDDVEWADVVVTMGCGDECPYVPGKRYVDWDLPDPAGGSEDDVRRLADLIEDHLAQLQP